MCFIFYKNLQFNNSHWTFIHAQFKHSFATKIEQSIVIWHIWMSTNFVKWRINERLFVWSCRRTHRWTRFFIIKRGIVRKDCSLFLTQSAVVLSRYVSFMHKAHGYIANSLWILSGMLTVWLIASDMFPEILPGTNILERCRWSRFRDPNITLPFYSLAKKFFENYGNSLRVDAKSRDFIFTLQSIKYNGRRLIHHW